MAAWTLRKRRPALGLTLLLVAVPLVVAAGDVTLPNTFTNATTADANEVNDDFDAVKTAVDDNHSRITALEGAIANFFSAFDILAAQLAADLVAGTARTHPQNS
jgi:hypothetical protein